MALLKMTQVQLAEAVAEQAGVSRAEAKKLLDALESVVTDNLRNCIRTQVAGVTIEPKYRAATKKRQGRNPATGEAVTIAAKPASVRVVGRVSKKLKDAAPTVRKLQNAL